MSLTFLWKNVVVSTTSFNNRANNKTLENIKEKLKLFTLRAHLRTEYNSDI